MALTQVYSIRDGEWEVMLDGKLVRATFNSKGAAEAAIPVERARRNTKKIAGAYYTLIGNRLGKVNGPWMPGNVWKADIYDVKPEFRAAWDDERITTRQRREISPEFDRVCAALSFGESNDVDPSLYTNSDCLGYQYGSKREATEAMSVALSTQ